ncbi:20762_t:CDS:2, partial [Rhizophagus irregularis]
MNSEYLSSLEEFEQDASDNDECSTNKISVQTVVDLYAKRNGFVANKIRKEVDSIDNSIIRCRVYTCWKSGIHKPKKVEDMNLHRD